MAKCTVCGAKAGFMMSMCDSCMQAQSASQAMEEPPPASPPTPTVPELLGSILETLRAQQADLQAIRRHTGCLYAWLLLSIILGILVFLVQR